jgi:hypothetical protein
VIGQDRRPGTDDLVGEAREQFSEHHGPPSQQGVAVSALRHSSTIGGIGRQHVPLHHSDVFVEVAQYARSDQAAHARPQYDRVFPQFCHEMTMSRPVSAA